MEEVGKRVGGLPCLTFDVVLVLPSEWLPVGSDSDALTLVHIPPCLNFFSLSRFLSVLRSACSIFTFNMKRKYPVTSRSITWGRICQGYAGHYRDMDSAMILAVDVRHRATVDFRNWDQLDPFA